jgi:prefoldin subunit 5
VILANLLLIAVLAGAPEVEALRRELDAVAARIEHLKARAQAGESVDGELEPLLVRSQELAEQIEGALPEPPSPPAEASSADAARERADELRGEAAALRAQAQRLGTALAGIDSRIGAALRATTATAERAPSSSPPRATLAIVTHRTAQGSPGAAAETALAPLIAERARVEAQVEALQAEAGRLEAEANALDGEQR